MNILFAGTEGWANPAARRKKVRVENPDGTISTAEGDPMYRKSPKSFTAERVFITPQHIHLGVDEPSGVELIIGHVQGPQGPRSTLTYHEFVSQPRIDFSVMVSDDAVPAEAWPKTWVQSQENGLGAVRSQSYGRFDVLRWERHDDRKALAGGRD